MITNKKTGDFFCPKCVAFDALKTVWNLQNSVNLLQACVDAKMPDEDEDEGEEA